MSSESTKSVSPEGYKRVQLGPREIALPVEWEIKPVRELFKIEKDSFDPSELESGSDTMLYSMPAYDSNREPIRTPASEIGSKKYRVPQDTILFPKLNIRKRRFWRVRHDHSLPAVCSTEYWPLLPTTSLELDFYHYYFDSYEFTSNPKVTSSSSTNSHKRVKQSSFEKLQLPIPPLPEQRRIADILSTVDEQIQQTNEMIEKTTELKRGLVQDLVTYGIDHESYREELLGPKIVELPDSWKVKRMVDVAEIVNGSTPKKSNPNYWGGDIYWATPTDVTGTEGVYLSDTEEKITETGLENCSADILQPGAVLMTSRATIGEAVINTVPVTTNQGFKSLVPGEDLRSEYLYYFVRTMADYLTEIGGGSTFPEINKSDAENIRVPVPPITEQKQIVDIITSAEQKRLDEISYKKHLQELKRGLMQDLLTGEVRVDTD